MCVQINRLYKCKLKTTQMITLANCARDFYFIEGDKKAQNRTEIFSTKNLVLKYQKLLTRYKTLNIIELK